jgi:hypothetical protein
MIDKNQSSEIDNLFFSHDDHSHEPNHVGSDHGHGGGSSDGAHGCLTDAHGHADDNHEVRLLVYSSREQRAI